MTNGERVRMLLGSVVAVAVGAGGMYLAGPALGMGASEEHVRKEPPAQLRLERSDRAFPLTGVVTGLSGLPLDSATVVAGDISAVTDSEGVFTFESVAIGPISVTRPGYLPFEYAFDGTVEEADIAMEVRIVRGIRVPPVVAGSDAAYQEMLDIAATTTVNTFVFDTKGDYDGGYVFYTTQVAAANDGGLVRAAYDPVQRLQQAHDAGLYTITRIPTFISSAYTAAYPENRLVTQFLDPGNRAAWEYPLSLAVEACNLGFDEIQFDYIRYPDGQASGQARSQGKTPSDQEARVANISGFLEEARTRLHPLGCAVSADIFGIINMAKNDQYLGQLVEDTSQHVDVYVPMIYPAQWDSDPGWFGYSVPSQHPKEVVGAVLDSALARVAPGSIVRPLVQGYSLTSSKILAEISAAEDRDLGWQVWNMDGVYNVASFPAGTTGTG
jgi:hypothetical protein